MCYSVTYSNISIVIMWDSASAYMKRLLGSTLYHMIMYTTVALLYKCDQACKNRAYLHIKFGFYFKVQFIIAFKVLKPFNEVYTLH